MTLTENEESSLFNTIASELDALIRQCTELEQKLSVVAENERRLESEERSSVQNLDGRFLAANERLTNARSQGALLSEAQAFTAELSQNVTRCTELKSRLDQVKAMKSSLERQRTALGEQLGTRFKAFSERVTQLVAAYAKARAELGEVRSKNELNLRESKGRVSELQGELNRLRKEREQLCARVESTTQALDQARAEKQEIQRKLSQLEGEYRAQKDSLDQQGLLILKEKQEKVSAFELLRASEEKNSRLNGELSEERKIQSGKLEQAYVRVAELECRIKGFQALRAEQSSAWQARELKLTSELQSARAELQKAAKQLRILEQQRGELASQAVLAREAAARETGSLQKLAGRLSESESRNQQLVKEVERAFRQLQELQISMAALEARNGALETGSGELKARNAELENRNAEIESRNAELNVRNAGLESRNSELESRNTELLAECAAGERRMDEVRAREEERIQSIESLLKNLGEQVRSVSVMQVPRIDDQLSLLAKAMEDTAREKEALKAEAGALQVEIDQLRKTQPLRALLRVKEAEIEKIDAEARRLSPSDPSRKQLSKISAMLHEQRAQLLKLIMGEERGKKSARPPIQPPPFHTTETR